MPEWNSQKMLMDMDVTVKPHGKDAEDEIFVAKITGAAAAFNGIVAHTWEEQRFDGSSRLYVRDEMGREGTATMQPAFDPNGGTVATGTYVYLKLRGFVNLSKAVGEIVKSGVVYDILGAAGSSSSDPDADWNRRGYVGAPAATPPAADPQNFGGKKCLLTGSTIRPANDPSSGGRMSLNIPTETTDWPASFTATFGANGCDYRLDTTKERLQVINGFFPNATATLYTGIVKNADFSMVCLYAGAHASNISRGNALYAVLDSTGFAYGATEDVVVGVDTLHFVGGLYTGKN